MSCDDVPAGRHEEMLSISDNTNCVNELVFSTKIHGSWLRLCPCFFQFWHSKFNS